MDDSEIGTKLAPWLSVSDATEAVAFYGAAFDAVPTYRLDDDHGGVAVARLKVGSAEFWVAHDPASETTGGVRMILTVGDPDAWMARALAAGATVVALVGEEHGWRTGRITDPFGHDWEFATPLDDAAQ